MNIQEVQALTDDEIRVRVAELCGIEVVPCTCEADPWKDNATGKHLPNYPADLNACHEAEEAWFRSNPNPVWKYSTNLEQIVERDWEAGMPDLNSVCFYRATARQRCEAFVLVTSNKTFNIPT